MRVLLLQHFCHGDKRLAALWVTIIEIPQAALKA
jgi:hypothetical protein